MTGGASGIGLAVVRAFNTDGFATVSLDTTESAEASISVQGDVRDPRSHSAAVDAAIRETGRLDVLVANAGVHDGGIGLDSEPDELLECLRLVLDIDVIGYALAAHAAAPALRESRGHVVLTLSDASFLVGQQGAGLAYTAAKHGAFGLLGWLARALAPEVRVNGIAPGGVVTISEPWAAPRVASASSRTWRRKPNRPPTQPTRDACSRRARSPSTTAGSCPTAPRSDRSGHSTRRRADGPLRPRRAQTGGGSPVPGSGRPTKASPGRGFAVPHMSDCSGTDSHTRGSQRCGSVIRSRPVVNSAMKPLGSWK